MKKIAFLAAALLLASIPARADYIVKDGNGVLKSFKAGTLAGSVVLPYQTPADASGLPYSAANPLAIQFGSGVLLPSFATPQHFICDSGCGGGGGGGGLSVPFFGPIGANGTPIGFKDASGNLQPTLGDVVNGQWVSIKASVPLTATLSSVTGPAANGAAASNSLLVGGQYNSSPLTLTNTQQSALQIDANGFLKVNVVLGGGGSALFGAAFPSTGVALGMTQGGLLTAITGTSGNLNVQCANCSGSGISTADQAIFTAGSSLFAGAGGFFQTDPTLGPLTNGTQGMFQATATRSLFTNLRNAAGTEVGTAGAPLQVSIANSGSNSNPVLVTGAGGTFPVTGTVTANLGTIGGVATQTTLAAILTNLGTPFQVGGSIGNTSFAVTQPSAANLNATVVGTGAFAVQATIATPTAWGVNTLGSTTSGSSGHLALGAVTTSAPSYTTAQNNALSLTTTGLLRVDGSGVTQPVSLAANQSINVAQINGVTPLMGNGLTGTGSQRVTVASDNTPFTVNAAQSGTWTFGVAQGSTTSGQVGMLAQAAVTTAAPAYTTAQTSPLSMDTSGNLRVSLITGFATSANQTTQISALSGTTLTNAHSCSVAGYSILGCLGQIDDDVKGPIPTQVSTVSIGGVGLFSGGTIMSATNGLYTNLLQGNAVIASGNPLFAQLTAGSAIIGQVSINQTTPGTTNLVSIGTNGTVNPTTAANWGLGTFGAAIGTVGNVLGLYDGTNLVRAKGDETNGIWVNIKAGAGSGGTALADEGAFTQGSTNMTPAGCLFTSSVANLTTGQGGVVRCTNDRQMMVSDAALLAAAQAAIPAGTNTIGAVTTPAADPCQSVVQTSTPISITTATTTRIVAPTSAKKTYICYLFITSAAADNVGVVEGTGGTCGSGTAGVIGGTTAANGPNFAANGGMSLTAGGQTAVAITAGTNVDLCLITSASTPLAGVIKWVQAP